MQRKEFETICAILGYNFKNERLLENALTHSSFVNENAGAVSNERLEFLGDTVLGFIVSEELYLNTFLSEGKMTEIRKPYVCADTLSDVMERSGLLQYLKTGKGALPLSKKTKSNVFEALLAAIYLDCKNFDEPRAFIKRMLGEIKMENFDPKSRLQEYSQAQRDKLKPEYVEERIENGCWKSTVSIGQVVLGKGEGESKKIAQREAAMAALKALKII
jgi:ribonuclease-3